MCNNTKCDKVPVKEIPSDTRIGNLINIFREEYDAEPDFIVKVPGRVNIIGEHIDYCGYPVLPLALEQDILIASKKISKLELFIRNSDKKYRKYYTQINTFEDIVIQSEPQSKPEWYNYVLCGIKGALEYLNNEIFYGMQFLVDGNIPPASGLSSSSALVSAACLSFLHGQDAPTNKTEIASLCARSERYIGTVGGGMDQAIAFLAEKYSAQYITFRPLKAEPVALPENAVFVVAHSLAEANKAATNDFNRRVIECRLAAKLLAEANGQATGKRIVTLSEVQTLLGKSLEEMIALVKEVLFKNVYMKHEICDKLNLTETELNDIYLTPNTRNLTEFKLKQRALHVYEEASRVESFRSICEDLSKDNTTHNGRNGSVTNGNGSATSFDSLHVLGELMSASHKSLKELYECSHENLDHLVDISKQMNVHSRLTGAGWGGCIVALCPKERVKEYIEMLIDKFYIQYCNIDKNQVHKYVFATTPNHGAIIYK
ncbi:unnamed protein product [Diatraea saccharalis]|uniref:N-acetylgalactosamine kinase n=1 Tax=Diatraea saccharalis TaxID=40085 RepID=A0A9N9RHZ7_9NEOP|nr:unnamed protein product [Diatraea saccharalis]